jgi:hypothetical protein
LSRRVPTCGFVRRFQIAALRNRNDTEADTELIRVANAMRRDNETPDATSARALYQVFRSRYTRSRVEVDPKSIGVSVDDQLATFKWLAPMAGDDDSGDANARVIATLEQIR